MSVLNLQDQATIVLSQQDYIPLMVESFLIDRKAQSVSGETLSFYGKKLKYFLAFCEAQAVTQVSQLTPNLIRRLFCISPKRTIKAACMPASVLSDASPMGGVGGNRAVGLEG